MCGEGLAPGATSGSARSMVSCEHPKRSMFCAEADCASSAPVASVFQNMMKKSFVHLLLVEKIRRRLLARWIAVLIYSTATQYHPAPPSTSGSAEPTYRRPVTLPEITMQGSLPGVLFSGWPTTFWKCRGSRVAMAANILRRRDLLLICRV